MRPTLYLAVVLVVNPVCHLSAAEPNTLTQQEKRQGFQLLFNGKNLDGWGAKSLATGKPQDGPWPEEIGGPQKEPWTVKDGAIYFPALYSWPKIRVLECRNKVVPGDFELRFDWKEAPDVAIPQPLPDGMVLAGHFSIGTYPFGERTEENWTGHLSCGYFAGERDIELVATEEITIPSKWAPYTTTQSPDKEARRPVGQWNESRMLCRGPLVQHWLNGKKILETDLRDASWTRALKSGNPLLDHWFKVKKHGYHLTIDPLGETAWFRSIRVRAIPKDEAPTLKRLPSATHKGDITDIDRRE